jgi:hypothetical protein
MWTAWGRLGLPSAFPQVKGYQPRKFPVHNY